MRYTPRRVSYRVCAIHPGSYVSDFGRRSRVLLLSWRCYFAPYRTAPQNKLLLRLQSSGFCRCSLYIDYSPVPWIIQLFPFFLLAFSQVYQHHQELTKDAWSRGLPAALNRGMSEIKVIRPSFLFQLACELHFVLYLSLLFVNKVEKEKLIKSKKRPTKRILSNGRTSRQASACFSLTFGISECLGCWLR